MSNATPFYRKYVQGVVSKANSQKVALQRLFLKPILKR